MSAVWTLCEKGRSRCQAVPEILIVEVSGCGTIAGYILHPSHTPKRVGRKINDFFLFLPSPSSRDERSAPIDGIGSLRNPLLCPDSVRLREAENSSLIPPFQMK
jgi:hypothetical protein